MNRNYLAIIEQDGDAHGGTIPEMNISVVGTSRDEVTQRLAEGLALTVALFEEQDRPVPEPRARTFADFGADVHEAYEGSTYALQFVAPAPMNPLSREIERAMRDQGITTQKQLAERLGVTRQAAARLIDPFYWGHSLASLLKVSQALGLRPSFTLAPYRIDVNAVMGVSGGGARIKRAALPKTLEGEDVPYPYLAEWEGREYRVLGPWEDPNAPGKTLGAADDEVRLHVVQVR